MFFQKKFIYILVSCIFLSTLFTDISSMLAVKTSFASLYNRTNKEKSNYSWLEKSPIDSICSGIQPPKGYTRIPVEEGSFAHWLRNLPLKEDDTPVFLYNGEKKKNQKAHFRVVDMDIGKRNLQQCADAIIRLKAEYLFSKSDYGNIEFDLTNGDKVNFLKWIKGDRPTLKGNSFVWEKKTSYSTTYKTFRSYLQFIFIYAGTYSLEKQLNSTYDVNTIKIGDVFIKGGFPGHAVIVLDMAENVQKGSKVFLLGQSYMPAQDFHVLQNPKSKGPWYEINFGETLYTPEWSFTKDSLKKF